MKTNSTHILKKNHTSRAEFGKIFRFTNAIRVTRGSLIDRKNFLKIEINKKMKSITPKQFDDWNNLKKELQNKQNKIHFKETEIWWVSIGQNIKSESF